MAIAGKARGTHRRGSSVTTGAWMAVVAVALIALLGMPGMVASARHHHHQAVGDAEGLVASGMAHQGVLSQVQRTLLMMGLNPFAKKDKEKEKEKEKEPTDDAKGKKVVTLGKEEKIPNTPAPLGCKDYQTFLPYPFPAAVFKGQPPKTELLWKEFDDAVFQLCLCQEDMSPNKGYACMGLWYRSEVNGREILRKAAQFCQGCHQDKADPKYYQCMAAYIRQQYPALPELKKVMMENRMDVGFQPKIKTGKALLTCIQGKLPFRELTLSDSSGVVLEPAEGPKTTVGSTQTALTIKLDKEVKAVNDAKTKLEDDMSALGADRQAVQDDKTALKADKTAVMDDRKSIEADKKALAEATVKLADTVTKAEATGSGGDTGGKTWDKDYSARSGDKRKAIIGQAQGTKTDTPKKFEKGTVDKDKDTADQKTLIGKKDGGKKDAEKKGEDKKSFEDDGVQYDAQPNQSKFEDDEGDQGYEPRVYSSKFEDDEGDQGYEPRVYNSKFEDDEGDQGYEPRVYSSKFEDDEGDQGYEPRVYSSKFEDDESDQGYKPWVYKSDFEGDDEDDDGNK